MNDITETTIQNNESDSDANIGVRGVVIPEIYGFSTEQYENGHQIETLQTGDGLTEFTDLYFDDGQVGIAMSYGDGIGVGEKRNHPDGTRADTIKPKWQIKFPNSGSLESMIERLTELLDKDVLPPSDCSGNPESCPDNEGFGCWCVDKQIAEAQKFEEDGSEY